MAVQLMATKGLVRARTGVVDGARQQFLAGAVSPVISTRASVPATMCACESFSSTSEERVMISARQSSSDSAKPEIFSAFCTWSSSSCLSTGLVRKPKAPSWVACTASGMVPCAVRMMTLRPG